MREFALGKIASVQQGYTFKPEYQGKASGKWMYVKVGDLNSLGNIKYVTRTQNYIDDDVLSKMKAKLFSAGSVVFSRVGAALRLNNKRLLAQDCLTDDNVLVVTVTNRAECYPEYLFYWFESQDIQRLCNDGTVPVISGKNLKKEIVALPTFPEQTAIADLLSTWDEAIDKTERLIAAKEHKKKAIMQSLLTGKQRLSGFQKPWSEFHLGELFKERSERGNYHLPLLSITRENGVIPRSEDRKDTSSEDKSNYLRICPGDIGYNTMRMWQGVSALSSFEGIVSPAYTICTPKKGVDGEFMAYLFKLPRVVNLFYRYSQGLTSDTWNLKYHHFRQIRVTIPEIKEQKAIARVLKGCDEEISLLKQQADALRRQKRGLMQKLLTGTWRVKTTKEAA